MADWRVGMVRNPRLPLALAVAASSAFPPVLSPCEIDLRAHGCVFEPGSGADLPVEPYVSKAVLTDGGVYDNLGLETAWKSYKTVLVSDGGGHIAAEPKPHRDCARHSFRVLETIDNQVRSLRTRQVIEKYKTQERLGAYWGIRTGIDSYGVGGALPCPEEKTAGIAAIATRLKRLDEGDQERLINWGYAACDASVRKFFDPGQQAPARFPYARGVD